MTRTQKIMAAHAGRESVQAGTLITARVDRTLANDITAPVAIEEFEKAGIAKIFDRQKVTLVLDHFVPNKDIRSAENCKKTRAFAKQHEIEHFYDVGTMGIEHVLLPDKGLIAPGDLVVGADSHTCTYGALGAFSTGVGSTDIAAAMATGELWFKVPSAIKVVLEGKPAPFVSGKDIILHLIGKIGVDGARYQSLEFFGEGISYLTMADRFTICNMAIEAGAKNGIFPVDEKTLDYLRDRVTTPYSVIEADEDAEYERVVMIDLSSLLPTVAYPHLPENTKTAEEAEKDHITIDQVVIGSCTNGRIEDLRAAAAQLEKKTVAKGVRTIIIPATQEIYLQAIKEGLIETFIEAGAIVSTPTCGPCLGGYMGVLAAGERCVSTTNRNFIGRMGHPQSEVYLASPAVAAASAVAGEIVFPRREELL